MNQSRAYEGNAPYVFISYAHADSDRILPIIAALQQQGIRVWYDVGIELATEWPENIARHLNNCTVCLAFVSQAAMNSSHCRREINFAIAQRKELVAVYLGNANIPLGMQMQLGSVQGIYYDRHPSMTSFVQELCRSEIISRCGGAAQQNNYDVDEASRLGMEYYQQRNYPEAVKYFRYAAENGCAASQTLLGMCYSNGYGVPKDDGEAVYWYQKAVNQGNDSAMMLLGMCYCLGTGVGEDFDKGIGLIQQSADMGCDEAKEMLNTFRNMAGYEPQTVPSADGETAYQTALKYYNRKEYERAIPYLAQAADKGQNDALYLLAKCYFFGDGIAQDISMGYMMMEEAADQGSYMAKQFLRTLNDDSNPLDE